MEFTSEIRKATDPIYQKISKVMPEIEWSVHAPYIHRINQLTHLALSSCGVILSKKALERGLETPYGRTHPDQVGTVVCNQSRGLPD